MPDSKDKDKMGSVSSSSAYGTGVFVREDIESEEQSFSKNVKVKTAEEIMEERNLDNAMHEGAQRNKRKAPRSVMDIHKQLQENEEKMQQAREKDAAHRAELQRNPTQYSRMPATETPANETPAERAGREAAAESVKQINKMESRPHVTTPAIQKDKAPAYNTKAIRGKQPQVNLEDKRPAITKIPAYNDSQLAAAAKVRTKVDTARKNEHRSSSRRKHATSEQRLEAKANKIFNESKSRDEKSPLDIFKQAGATDNIRKPGRK